MLASPLLVDPIRRQLIFTAASRSSAPTVAPARAPLRRPLASAPARAPLRRPLASAPSDAPLRSQLLLSTDRWLLRRLLVPPPTAGLYAVRLLLSADCRPLRRQLSFRRQLVCGKSSSPPPVAPLCRQLFAASCSLRPPISATKTGFDVLGWLAYPLQVRAPCAPILTGTDAARGDPQLIACSIGSHIEASHANKRSRRLFLNFANPSIPWRPLVNQQSSGLHIELIPTANLFIRSSSSLPSNLVGTISFTVTCLIAELALVVEKEPGGRRNGHRGRA